MSNTVDTLVLDLLEWIGPTSRPYYEVIEAWRTSCPRMTIWEDTNDLGFIERHHYPGHEPLVSLTAEGKAYLAKHRPRPKH